jgi:hypothetical protein
MDSPFISPIVLGLSFSISLAFYWKSKFPRPVCPFQKARPSDTLLFEKSKGQPFETFTPAQEIKRSQRILNPMNRTTDSRKVSRKQKSVNILVGWIS